MTLKFIQTEEDFVNFNEYYIAKYGNFFSKNPDWSYAALALIFTFQIAIDKDISKPDDIGYFLIPFSAMFLGFFGGRYSIYRRKQNIKKYAKLNPQNIGPREFEFDGNKIIVKTDISISEYATDTIINLDENETYIYLFISKATAFILPKRKLSLEELDYLRNEIVKVK